MREDIAVGGTFPDYRLPDQDGQARSLGELQGANPMVLHLSRGGFDPKERRFVSRLADAHVDFKLAYTALVVITTDDQLGLAEFRDGVGASFPFLSDAERRLQRELDIQEYTDPVHDPMIPHTFVLAPGLRIEKIYDGYWYWGRPTIDELHQDLRGVMRVSRPDFDLATPGLREAWDAGDTARFLVDPVEGSPIRYTEGNDVGVKR
jgi:peroxiredoxin